MQSPVQRHARAETPRRVTRRGPRLRGHPRLSCELSARKTWMAATSQGMTRSKCPSMEPDLSNVIETRLLRTRAPGAPAIEIGILEKRSSPLDLRLPPTLLLHGATFGALRFGLPGSAA